jgi:hypothetical protein
MIYFNLRIELNLIIATVLEQWNEEEQEWLSWCDEEGNEVDDYELVDGKADLCK